MSPSVSREIKRKVSQRHPWVCTEGGFPISMGESKSHDFETIVKWWTPRVATLLHKRGYFAQFKHLLPFWDLFLALVVFFIASAVTGCMETNVMWGWRLWLIGSVWPMARHQICGPSGWDAILFYSLLIATAFYDLKSILYWIALIK